MSEATAIRGGIESQVADSTAEEQLTGQDSRTSAKPPHSKTERRRMCVDAEFRVGEPDAEGRTVLDGYASVFDKPTDMGGWAEVIRPGAFTKTLKDGADVRALINHNPDLILARSKSGTLVLEEDGHGLRVLIDPAETSYATDLVESIRRGDVDQMSFAFRAVKDRWTRDGDSGIELREVLEAQLFDVSPVTYPAYESTSIGVDVRGMSADELATLRKSIDRRLDELATPEPQQVQHSGEEAAPDAQGSDADALLRMVCARRRR